MGSVASHQLAPSQLLRYQAETGFSILQLEQLNARFRALDRFQRGYLTPTELLRIPQLAQNPLHHQIVDLFFTDRDPNARLFFPEFLEICAKFMVPQTNGNTIPRGGRAQKLRLISKMFDTQASGRIKRPDFQRIMRTLLAYELDDKEPEMPHKPKDKKSKEIKVTPEIEAEIALLELQAFGSGNRQEISYEQFEQCLLVADVTKRLSVAKWLVDLNGPKDAKDAKGAKDPKAASDPKAARDRKDASDPKDAKDPKDSKDPKDASDPKDARDPKDAGDFNDARGSLAVKDTEDSGENNIPKDAKDPKPQHPRQLENSAIDAKELGDAKAARDPKDARNSDDSKDPKDLNDPRDAKEPEDAKDPKHPTEFKDSGDPKDTEDLQKTNTEDLQMQSSVTKTIYEQKALNRTCVDKATSTEN